VIKDEKNILPGNKLYNDSKEYDNLNDLPDDYDEDEDEDDDDYDDDDDDDVKVDEKKPEEKKELVPQKPASK